MAKYRVFDKVHLWLMLVQTAVLKSGNESKTKAVDVIALAATVDPKFLESNPLDMRSQVTEFVYWRMHGGDTPEWISEWRNEINGVD